jgi:release factor glutamine methyltransferase
VTVEESPAVVTTAGLVADVTDTLAAAGVASPRVEARWLVCHVLGCSAADLVRAADQAPTPAQVATVHRLAERRVRREPLQLVLGGTEFRGHRLALRPGVFIPRPETELLVDHAIGVLPAGGVAVEPCTGSGAVGCAIAIERPDARVVATDVSAAAVALAVRNAERLGARVDVRSGVLLDPVPSELRGRVDVLVSNPPYLAEGDVEDLPIEVARWDPRDALVAGPTGHEVSDKLIAAARHWLAPGGWLMLELDERRVSAAASRATAAGLRAAETRSDLTGRPRFLVARRAS